MGDLLQFRKREEKKPPTPQEQNKFLQQKIDNIKSSIARINALMAELRSTPNEKSKHS